jgi:hypothetical protein
MILRSLCNAEATHFEKFHANSQRIAWDDVAATPNYCRRAISPTTL